MVQTIYLCFLGGLAIQRHGARISPSQSSSVQGLFYNPQVDEWSEDLVALEAKRKQEASILLFVVDGSTRSIASMVEAAELIASGRKVIIVLEDIVTGKVIAGQPVKGRELKDLNRARAYLADVAQRHSVVCFNDVVTACLHAVRWCKSLGAKADDVGAEEVALSISTKTDAPEPAFTVGMKVRARFAGKGHFYPARISKCNTDGTYDLTYLDGDWEEVRRSILLRYENGRRASYYCLIERLFN